MEKKRDCRRDEAFRLYIESEGSKKIKELAEFLGVPYTRVSNWKRRDKWDEELRKPPEQRNVPKRRAGAPFGNRNAIGNAGGKNAPKGNQYAVGHGAPLRNQNHLVTGEHAAIWADTLTDDERDLCSRVNLDSLVQIDQDIGLLAIRERRMMLNIKKLKEEKRLAEFEDVLVPTKEQNGKTKERIKSRTRYIRLKIDRIIAAEEALTRVQEAKRRAIETKQRLLKEKENQETGASQENDLLVRVLQKAWGSKEERNGN